MDRNYIYKFSQWISEAQEESMADSDAILADKIKDVYLQNLSSMSFLKQQHFLSRLAKCYPNKWENEIKEIGQKLARNVGQLYTEYKSGNFEDSISSFVEVRNSNNAQADAKRAGNKWVEKMGDEIKGFLSYLELLMMFNITCRLKSKKWIDNSAEIEDLLIKDWDKNIDWVLNNSESFRFIPVQSVNIFYYMSSLNIMDTDKIAKREKEYLNKLKNEYKDKLEDRNLFNNYLYALTHIIIGKSWFYEYKLPDYKRNYKWVIDFFKENRERIIAKSTPDIIIETGVVMLICNENKEAEYYKKFARSKIGEKNYVEPLDNSKGPEESEHTNILAIMLLKGF